MDTKDKNFILTRKSDGKEVARFATMDEFASYAMDESNECGKGYVIRNVNPKYVNTVGHAVME